MGATQETKQPYRHVEAGIDVLMYFHGRCVAEDLCIDPLLGERIMKRKLPGLQRNCFFSSLTDLDTRKYGEART